MAELVLMAALTRDRLIGKGGRLPWHLPADLKRFKQITTGHTVIMGRRTWEGLPRPLPRRHNIVLSTSLPTSSRAIAPDTRLDVVASLDAALRRASTPKVFIIGGATLYAQTLPIVNRLDLTFVEGSYDGDTFFPPYQDWLHQSFHQVDQQQHDEFCVEVYQR
ncbi:MAG: dihydrofolate reductase [Elainellaceae cyanobacterium]